LGRKRGRIRAKVDEDVSVPDVDINGIEGKVFAAEIIVGVRRADQAAIKAIGPPVIAALQALGEMALGLRTDAVLDMPTDIEKCPQRVAPVTCDDDAFTRNLAKKVVPWHRDSICPPPADPVIAKEAFYFFTVEIGIGVVAGGQGRGGWHF